jgi:hypothetical protein
MLTGFTAGRGVTITGRGAVVSAMPVVDSKRSFPPVQGTFTLKQGSDSLPMSAWTKVFQL